MIQANTNNRWARLSQSEKAELLGIYASKGYHDLANIIAHYNSCGGKLHASGGPVTNTAQYKDNSYLYNPPVNVGAPIEVPLRYKPLPDYGDYVPQRTTGIFDDAPIELRLDVPQIGYGVLMSDTSFATPILDARQDAARRIMAVENSKNNVDGGYDAKTGRWYPHKSHEGGADTIAYGIKLSNGTPEAALALKQGYLTDEQAVSAVDSLVQKYYDAAKSVYDGKYGAGEWDKLSDKSQSILVDYSYNPGLAKFPKLMEGFHSGNLDLIRQNYKRYSGGKELGRNKVLLEELDTLENEYPIFRKDGGSIHIKPSHRGRLTELKARTGKSEAELYNDGNPAHKKMVVFARNARKWKHADGGVLDNYFEDGGPVNIYDGETEPTQKMDVPVKFDKPLKLAEIPTRNRVNVIDNYSNNYNYIVEGDKIYYAKKGNDYWVDISDNETARRNLLNFISQRYDFKGYEDSERDILGLITNNNFNYQEYHNRKPEPEKKKGFTDYRLYSPVPPVSRISDAPIYKDQKKETPPVIVEEPKQTKEDVDLREVQRILLAGDPANYDVQRDALRSDIVYDPTNSIPRYEPTLLELLMNSDNPNVSGLAETVQNDGFRGLFNVGKNAISRVFDKWNSDKEEQMSSMSKEYTLGDSDYGIIPGSFTGDTLRYSPGVLPREYFIPESINVKDHKFGARNKGDYTELNTEGAVVTTFNAFLPYNKDSIKDTNTYVGIDSQGNLKVGPGSIFGDGDLLTRTWENKIYNFAKDSKGNYKFSKGDSKGRNKAYNFALVNVEDEKTGQIKESTAFNILVNPSDKSGNTYGSVTGGRVLVRVGDELRLLSGSVKQIEEQFEAMKERQGADHGYFYVLDNGSYNKALRTRDRRLTRGDLTNYDAKNTTGGNFLYLAGDKDSVFPSDTVLTPNVRTEKDESYLNGHPLINENRGVVLHYTAFNGNDMEGVTSHFMNPKSGASSHVVIGKNGERRVFADPEKVTFHAGYSSFGGRDNVNDFMNGIEFMAAGPNEKLTDAQVQSAVEYLLPIIRKYNIPLENITTHEVVRRNYKEAHPKEKVPPKSDLSPAQYNQVIEALKKAVYYEKPKEEIPMFNWDIDPEILAKPMKNGGPLQKYADFSGLF